MHEMFARVMAVMQEQGVIKRIGTDEDADDALVEQVMDVLEFQGHRGNVDNFALGIVVLLPPRESGFSLLLVTPCKADEYDDELVRKPFPIQFDRTACGEVILPARWLITQLEALAKNPAAAPSLQTMALQLSRRGDIPATVMPRDTSTTAVTVGNADGTQSVYEALPGGNIIDIEFRQEPGT
jgi:hypothetical protein